MQITLTFESGRLVAQSRDGRTLDVTSGPSHVVISRLAGWPEFGMVDVAGWIQETGGSIADDRGYFDHAWSDQHMAALEAGGLLDYQEEVALQA